LVSISGDAPLPDETRVGYTQAARALSDSPRPPATEGTIQRRTIRIVQPATSRRVSMISRNYNLHPEFVFRRRW